MILYRWLAVGGLWAVGWPQEMTCFPRPVSLASPSPSEMRPQGRDWRVTHYHTGPYGHRQPEAARSKWHVCSQTVSWLAQGHTNRHGYFSFLNNCICMWFTCHKVYLFQLHNCFQLYLHSIYNLIISLYIFRKIITSRKGKAWHSKNHCGNLIIHLNSTE